MSIFSQKHTRESLASLDQYELADLVQYYEIKVRGLDMIDAILKAQEAEERRTALPASVDSTGSIEDWLG